MRKVKLGIVICICILFGLAGFVGNLLYKWTIMSDKQGNISFVEWIKTSEGLSILMDGVGDIGISLISSAIFLVCVDWVINSVEEHRKRELDIEQKRFFVLGEMRTNPKKLVQSIKNAGDIGNGLFTNQFFCGCDFSNLILDSIDFSGSNLSSTKFSNASLIGANLLNCSMQGTDITNAKLAFANLVGTKLTDSELRTANSLWNAVLPNGKKYDGSFMLEGDIQQARKLGLDIINDESQKEVFYKLNKD